jgi:hypothetical protein
VLKIADVTGGHRVIWNKGVLRVHSHMLKLKQVHLKVDWWWGGTGKGAGQQGADGVKSAVRYGQCMLYASITRNSTNKCN